MKFPKSKRARRVGVEIQKIVAERIRELIMQDFPQVIASVPEVRVSDDLGVAAIYTSIHGAEDEEAVRKKIQRNGKRLRQEAASALRIRKIPEFRFVWDDTMERADRIEQLLKKANNSSSNPPEEDPRGAE